MMQGRMQLIQHNVVSKQMDTVQGKDAIGEKGRGGSIKLTLQAFMMAHE